MGLAINRFPARTAADYYGEVRGKLRDGDVLICSGSGIFSAMIQQATRSVWSHVGLVLKLDTIDRIMLLESVEPVGVRTVRLSKYLENYGNDGKPYPGGLAVIRHREFAAKASAAKLKKLAQFAVDRFGYPYDREQIGKIAARILASRIPFTRKQREQIAPNNEYICSEYVARCYQEMGLRVRWNRKGFIAPADFAADPGFELVAVLKPR